MKNMYNLDFPLSYFADVLDEIDSMPWKCDIDNETIFQIALKNFENLVGTATKYKNCVRISGQSGSGKTTQLLPSSLFALQKNNISPIHFCVRKFAVLHPDFEKIVREKGKNIVREITNSFALRCLTFSLALAIFNGFDIVLEVTLLTDKYEEFIYNCLQKMNYHTLNICLAVNKKVSDRLIDCRTNSKNSLESGRIVSHTSSDYFFTTFCDAISHFAKAHPNERIIIYNVYDKLPVFDGKAKDCITTFTENQKREDLPTADEKELLEAKQTYLLNHFKPNLEE